MGQKKETEKEAAEKILKFRQIHQRTLSKSLAIMVFWRTIVESEGLRGFISFRDLINAFEVAPRGHKDKHEYIELACSKVEKTEDWVILCKAVTGDEDSEQSLIRALSEVNFTVHEWFAIHENASLHEVKDFAEEKMRGFNYSFTEWRMKLTQNDEFLRIVRPAMAKKARSYFQHKFLFDSCSQDEDKEPYRNEMIQTAKTFAHWLYLFQKTGPGHVKIDRIRHEVKMHAKTCGDCVTIRNTCSSTALAEWARIEIFESKLIRTFNDAHDVYISVADVVDKEIAYQLMKEKATSIPELVLLYRIAFFETPDIDTLNETQEKITDKIRTIDQWGYVYENTPVLSELRGVSEGKITEAKRSFEFWQKRVKEGLNSSELKELLLGKMYEKAETVTEYQSLYNRADVNSKYRALSVASLKELLI